MKRNYQMPSMNLVITAEEDVLRTSTTGGEIGNVSKPDDLNWNL